MSVPFSEYGFFNGTWEFNQVNWAKMFSPLVNDGVMAGIGGELEVYADSAGMTVHVRTGECRARGHRGSLETEANLPIAAADSVNPRLDMVVARVRYGSPSAMELDVLTGAPAEEPVLPELTQTAADVWEIPLATVKVAANTTTVAAADVSDYRYVYSGGGVGAVKLKNGESTDLQKGELVVMSFDEANTVVRCGLNEAPIGVVETNTIAAGATGNIQTISGAQVEIKCDADAVQVGDTLVPSATAGQARRGGGYGAGYALEAKAAGAVGNVKGILAVLSRLRNPNRWYLTDGITEENVVAAYRFKGAATLQEALTNINDGTEYVLAATSGITWTTGKGLFFPGVRAQYINSSALVGMSSSIWSCAFGYSDMSTGNVVTSGTTLAAAATTNPKYLLAKGSVHDSGGNPTYLNSAIPQSASKYYPKHNANVTERGCLSCDWSAYKMWRDGLAQSTTSNNSSYPTYNAGWTTGRVFTTTTQTNSTIVRGTMYLSALVFYNCVLTDTQHAQLAEQINAL